MCGKHQDNLDQCCRSKSYPYPPPTTKNTSTSRARHGGASGIASVIEREIVVMRSTTLLSPFWSFCLVLEWVRRSGREGRWARTPSGFFYKLSWGMEQQIPERWDLSSLRHMLSFSPKSHGALFRVVYPKTRPGTLRPMPVPSKSAFGAIMFFWKPYITRRRREIFEGFYPDLDTESLEPLV